jgi:hypothetical protein
MNKITPNMEDRKPSIEDSRVVIESWKVEMDLFTGIPRISSTKSGCLAVSFLSVSK